MNAITRHLSRCFIAGIVALLPTGSLVLTVVYMEYTIASSGLKEYDAYFPGLGLLAVAAILYLLGLTLSSFLGRWLWKRVDQALTSLPALGQFYKTLKQILGYGEGKEGLFQRVVLIPSRDTPSEELGLVTNEVVEPDGTVKLVVFVPGAPNPTAGRLIVIDARRTRRLDIRVNDALKTLVSVGKTDISLVGGQS